MRQGGSLHEETGAGLVFALVVMLLVAIAAQAALAVLAYEAKAAATARDAVAAFQVAEAGFERAVFELARDPDWTDRRGATSLLGVGGSGWALLCLNPGADGACTQPADFTAFPATHPLGTFVVSLKARAGPECGEEGCVCVRSTGRAGIATRRVEGVLARDRPGQPVRVVGWREVLAEHDPMSCD
ncbi:MAG: hypothetical protein QN144_12000 [Armatimonadota bacterium]|nr:hypothetical protein [Armatimonadota bacterium]